MADVNSVSNRKTAILALLAIEDMSWTTLLYESKRQYMISRRYGLHRLAIDSLVSSGDIELSGDKYTLV